MESPSWARIGAANGSSYLENMLVDVNGRELRIGVYGLAVAGGLSPTILLARLGPQEAAAGVWTLPGGGLDWGEHPLDGLKREFMEETGLVPEAGRPLGVHSYSLTPDERHTPGPPIQVIQVIYPVVAAGVPVNEVGGSTSEARWFLLSELDSLPIVDLVKIALDLREASRPAPGPTPPTC